MTEEITIEHTTWTELSDYHFGGLPWFVRARIEEHLGECAACSEIAVRVRTLCEAWTDWTPEAHGAASLRLRIVHALATLSSMNLKDAEKDLPQLLREWNEKWKGKVSGALRVVVDAVGKESKLVAEGLQAVLCPGPMPVFALAGTLPVRGGANPVVAESKAGESSPATRVVLTGNDLRVTVSSLSPGSRPPVIVLVPEGDEPPQSQRLKKDARDAKLYVTDFKSVTGGAYTLTFLWM